MLAPVLLATNTCFKSATNPSEISIAAFAKPRKAIPGLEVQAVDTLAEALDCAL